MYAKSSDQLNNLYQAIVDDPIVKKHRKYEEHLASVFETRKAWAICFRSNLLTRGNNTTNYVESAMRIVKDKVLYRLKAYSVTQLVDFLLTRKESYYAADYWMLPTTAQPTCNNQDTSGMTVMSTAVTLSR